MNLSHDFQSLVRRFDDEEAIWRRYWQKRDLRRLRSLPGLFPDEVEDCHDWLAAERECCEIRCVGMLVP